MPMLVIKKLFKISDMFRYPISNTFKSRCFKCFCSHRQHFLLWALPAPEISTGMPMLLLCQFWDLQEKWPWRDKVAIQWACPPGKTRCSITGPRVTQVSLTHDLLYWRSAQCRLTDRADLLAHKSLLSSLSAVSDFILNSRMRAGLSKNAAVLANLKYKSNITTRFEKSAGTIMNCSLNPQPTMTCNIVQWMMRYLPAQGGKKTLHTVFWHSKQFQ